MEIKINNKNRAMYDKKALFFYIKKRIKKYFKNILKMY